MTNVEQTHPTWPDVRCTSCALVYDRKKSPVCPRCGYEKFNTAVTAR